MGRGFRSYAAAHRRFEDFRAAATALEAKIPV
jgi:hypothetical protein